MNYEQKYKDTLDLARTFYEGYIIQGHNGEAGILAEIFPELAENEDEKIRKCVKYAVDKLFLKEKIVCDVHKEDVIAWLEKQGESNSQTVLTIPKFTFNDVLALQCCMETVKKVQEDKELYEKLKDLHSKVYDSYQLEKQGDKKNTCKRKIDDAYLQGISDAKHEIVEL